MNSDLRPHLHPNPDPYEGLGLRAQGLEPEPKFCIGALNLAAKAKGRKHEKPRADVPTSTTGSAAEKGDSPLLLGNRARTLRED